MFWNIWNDWINQIKISEFLELKVNYGTNLFRVCVNEYGSEQLLMTPIFLEFLQS